MSNDTYTFRPSTEPFKNKIYKAYLERLSLDTPDHKKLIGRGLNHGQIITAGYRSKGKNSVKITRDACLYICLLYTSPSPRDEKVSRMPSSA